MPSKTRTRRPRAQQQRTRDTRERLLNAAVKEFAAHGYSGASTRNVSREAGVPHGLIAYHFGGKTGLWRAVIELLLDGYRERAESRLRSLKGKDAVTQLRALQEDLFDFSPERLDFHRIMADVARTRGAQLKWVVREHFRHVYDLRASLIRKAQRSRRYVAGDPYHLQYALLGAYLMPLLLGPELSEMTGRSVQTSRFQAEHRRLCLSLFFRG